MPKGIAKLRSGDSIDSVAGTMPFTIFRQHPQRYLNEFSYRFNNRKAADLFGMTVRRMASAGNTPYAELTAENAFTPFVRPQK